jgi:hypothetical protein
MNTRTRLALALLSSLWGAAAFAQAAGNVYVPLPERCRVADSRTQNPPFYMGTPLGAAETRGINILNGGAYALQGGTGSHGTCVIPNNATALSVSLTALPTGTAGFMKIFRGGGTWQNGNTVGFSANTPIANDVIVPVNAAVVNDVAVYANVPTNYTIDVVGYFRAPQITCTNVSESFSASAGSGTSGVEAACPANTTVAQASCIANIHVLKSSWSYNVGDPGIFGPTANAGHLCLFGNLTAAADTITARARCCSAPQ